MVACLVIVLLLVVVLPHVELNIPILRILGYILVQQLLSLFVLSFFEVTINQLELLLILCYNRDTWKQEQQYTIYFCHFHLLHFLVLNRYGLLLLLINPLTGHFSPFEVFF